MRTHTRILVIGGGPAGSTAATLLAKEGFEVTLLEAATFPRYHIGESILPSALPVLDLLGVREKIEEYGFVRKGGAYFEWGPENWELNFNHLEGSDTYSYQVIRSEFDKLLLDNARENGVDVHDGIRVAELGFDGARPVSATWTRGRDKDDSGTITFDFLVDASGRNGVMATKYLKNRQVNEAFKNIATWSYFRNVKPLDKGPEGAIAVCSVPDGWFWAIPLHDGTHSVGLVRNAAKFAEQRQAAGGDLGKVFFDAVESSSRIKDMLAGAESVADFKAEQDYSYSADSFAGPGYVLAGDAACFLDPLLSTGVHLATFSGLLAGAGVSSLLREELTEEEALGFYTQAYRQAYERLLILVSFFYKSFSRQSQFFEAQKLTRRERHMLNLYESFLYVVTGVEDIADSKDSALDAVARRMAESGHLFAGENEALAAMPTSERNAVGGIYLVFEPRLGLRKRTGVTEPQPSPA
ncbi:tryptophan 7-halogenase [Actinocorallia sp. API 0066]|uniref:NAD(P)/FAD-dependent oxidoreductase n=1 Tax=Actinocorallia sp. API 0066 TaxID=2896846 RepID=UPI001E5650B5|nr:NAD(P)/FAD-dependent oxidoreductase [Actinocorallia sp. API 0066]MCD0453475.1 tryptophan 7-halogenase [Actinocorallia sp. API 0066]